MKVLFSVLIAVAVSSPLALARSVSPEKIPPQMVAKGQNPSGPGVCRAKSHLTRNSDLSIPKKEFRAAEVLGNKGAKVTQ